MNNLPRVTYGKVGGNLNVARAKRNLSKMPDTFTFKDFYKEYSKHLITSPSNHSVYQYLNKMVKYKLIEKTTDSKMYKGIYKKID